ncbi:MAG: hypothetical protein GXO86_10090 [Chlorobi bacterium]|nr:hypothetical protein [Chlorobiota bacterium]
MGLFTFSLDGCYKFEGDQTVPAYLKIDSISVVTYFPEEGTSSSKITDVWAYLDDNLVGVFELPALFPVLARGKHKLQLKAGIMLNGISSTRVPYPFYLPVDYADFEFYEDSVQVPPVLTTEYYPGLNFAWMEDFENEGLKIDETSISDTVIERTQEGAFITPTSKYSGVIHLTTEKPIYSAVSYDLYPMPKAGTPTMLEMNFKTDNLFNVGLLIQEQGQIIKLPLVILAHSSEWNKIYINLGPNLSLHSKATGFKVLLEGGLELEKQSATIYLDNIKMIYRNL